ncbi:MAG: hypothetical protein QOF48_3691 [Verrucomicrobiota bacterium]
MCTFKRYFQVVRNSNDQPTIQNPFFHLSGDGFWSLVPAPRQAPRYRPGATSGAPSVAELHRTGLTMMMARFLVSPFQCTHAHIESGPSTDHAHEFERFWEIDNLPGRELLQACAEIYDRLDDLVRDAHRRLGWSMLSHRPEGSQRALPCMVAKHRTVRTVVKEGREVWENEPLGLHGH